MGSGKNRATHIVWDWNGTLLHDIDAVLEATNAALAEIGQPAITLERYRELYCIPIHRFYQRMMGRLPTEEEWAAMDGAFHRCYFARAVGVGLTDGAAHLLAELQAAGRTQSLCSLAHHDHLVPLVRSHGIESRFLRVDGNLDGHGAGGGKARQMARHLAGMRGVAPDRVVVIGDAVDDAVAASHVGARAVLYSGGSHSRASLESAGVPVADTLAEAVERAAESVS